MRNDPKHVVRWRQRAKEKLVAAFGGSCGICGYKKSVRALTFHHLDPSQKAFAISGKGIPRAWKRIMDEAEKCVMLCHNCHDEVHDGVTEIPADIRKFVRPKEPLPMRRGHVMRRLAQTELRSKFLPNPQPCATCGEPTRTGKKYCSVKCSTRALRRVDRPEGKSLRNMVSQTSRVAIAARYGVSERAVRKWLEYDSRNGIQ